MKKEADAESGKSTAAPGRDSKQLLVEGLDYYLEGGLMVFTARFLLRRGYCCKNGCRHCPYQETTKE